MKNWQLFLLMSTIMIATHVSAWVAIPECVLFLLTAMLFGAAERES